ncbi:MAG: hypothetical protein KAS36_10815, partial [Anaerolineales bacterium]|nr:hypothetical protein [Anaerolineales bacterium]
SHPLADVAAQWEDVASGIFRQGMDKFELEIARIQKEKGGVPTQDRQRIEWQRKEELILRERAKEQEKLKREVGTAEGILSELYEYQNKWGLDVQNLMDQVRGGLERAGEVTRGRGGRAEFRGIPEIDRLSERLQEMAERAKREEYELMADVALAETNHWLSAITSNTEAMKNILAEVGKNLTTTKNQFVERVAEVRGAGEKITTGDAKAILRMHKNQPGFEYLSEAKQAGGNISGPGGIDKVPAMLTAGEYVIKKGSVDKLRQFYGDDVLDYINQRGQIPGFADGGPTDLGRLQKKIGEGDRGRRARQVFGQTAMVGSFAPTTPAEKELEKLYLESGAFGTKEAAQAALRNYLLIGSGATFVDDPKAFPADVVALMLKMIEGPDDTIHSGVAILPTFEAFKEMIKGYPNVAGVDLDSEAAQRKSYLNSIIHETLSHGTKKHILTDRTLAPKDEKAKRLQIQNYLDSSLTEIPSWAKFEEQDPLIRTLKGIFEKAGRLDDFEVQRAKVLMGYEPLDYLEEMFTHLNHFRSDEQLGPEIREATANRFPMILKRMGGLISRFAQGGAVGFQTGGGSNAISMAQRAIAGDKAAQDYFRNNPTAMRGLPTALRRQVEKAIGITRGTGPTRLPGPQRLQHGGDVLNLSMGELAAKTSFTREEMDAIAASNVVVDIRDNLIQEEKKLQAERDRRLSYGLPAERTTPSAPKAGGRTKSLAEQLASATAEKTPRTPTERQLEIFMDLLETEGPERALRMLSGITGVTGAVGPRTMTQISEVLTGPVRTKKASYGPKDLGLEPFPPRG